MKLYKYNSYYEMTDVQQNSPLFNKIDAIFSCFNFKSKTRYGRLYLNIGDTIRIPSSVSEELLEKEFYVKPINREYDMPPQDKFFNMINQPRNELQERSIRYLIEDPAVHKVLSLNTSAGKTYVTINAISQMKLNAIILVDTISLAKQWADEVIKHTDSDKVQIINASDIENDLVEDGNIFIITQQSIDSLMLRDYHKLNDFILEKQIGIKVFDESHTRFHDLARINCVFNTVKTIYLTATFDRNYTEIKQFKAIFSGVSKMIEKTEDLYRDIKLVRFKSGPAPTDYDVNYVVGLQGASSTLWGKYILRKEARLRRPLITPVIKEIIRKLEIQPTLDNPLCIILPLNEMCNNIADHLSELDYSVSVYNSDTVKKSSKQDIFNNQIILTNSMMFSKGIDVPQIKWLINFTSVSSLIAVEQTVGRLRRGNNDDEVKVYIDCVDISFGDSFIKQQKVRKRYFKKITVDLEGLDEKNVIKIELK